MFGLIYLFLIVTCILGISEAIQTMSEQKKERLKTKKMIDELENRKKS